LHFIVPRLVLIVAVIGPFAGRPSSASSSVNFPFAGSPPPSGDADSSSGVSLVTVSLGGSAGLADGSSTAGGAASGTEPTSRALASIGVIGVGDSGPQATNTIGRRKRRACISA
jgi:hypothetical protein